MIEEGKIFENDSTIGVIDYLIALYNSTEKEYNYYPSKLNRLLTIYYLCVLKYSKGCLDEDFVIEDNGRMGYKPIIFDSIYERNDWRIRTTEDKKTILDKIDYNNIKKYKKEVKIKFNSEYEIISESFKIDIQKKLIISDYSEELIELIFRKFGNYSINDLAPMIDEIVSKLPLEKKYFGNYVNYEKYELFRLENKKKYEDNEVFEFVENFKPNDLKKQVPTAKVKRLLI